MGNKQKLYWASQICGWLFYVIINLFFYGLSNTTSTRDFLAYLILFVMGIVLTHAFRFFILHSHILERKIGIQLMTIFISSALLSLLFFGLGSLFQITIFNLEVWLNGLVPFLFWSFIYFGFHYLENYKKTEIQNLKWEASSKEIELNKLKSQLNPHFMFNSMNSIRALIDENPIKAKEAVTQLSNILRNTLLMNKNREISVEEEISIVQDYLELEQIRYEERLKYNFDIDEKALSQLVPPLIIQAQVENAIKHGISKLPNGGLINIKVHLQNKMLTIDVRNTGVLHHEESETGFGLLNTRQRLQLLYGNKASINIIGENQNEVVVKIKIDYN